MKLLVSFNLLDLEAALSIARSIKQHVDFFTIGPLLIYHYGIKAIENFKEAVPGIPLIAQAHLIERPQETVKLFSDAGASWITVLAGAETKVITTACNTARIEGTKILLDLADASSIGQSSLDAKRFGAEALSFYKPSVEDARIPFSDRWEMARGNTELPIFISAHITRENVGEILGLNPSGIIIGSAIVKAEDPLKEATYFSELLKK